MNGFTVKFINNPFLRSKYVQHLSLHQLKPNIIKPNFLNKPFFGFRKTQYKKSDLRTSGDHIYAICAEYPDFEQFINQFNMQDSFQSWFSITSLHVWLCFIRLRREGADGYEIKDRILRSFRVLKKRAKQVNAFNDQLYGSILSYDEGLLSSSDSLLACALWQNLLMSSNLTTPRELELGVQYVRKQLAYLDKMPSDRVTGKGIVSFLPIVGEKLDRDYVVDRLLYCLKWPEHINA